MTVGAAGKDSDITTTLIPSRPSETLAGSPDRGDRMLSALVGHACQVAGGQRGALWLPPEGAVRGGVPSVLSTSSDTGWLSVIEKIADSELPTTPRAVPGVDGHSVAAASIAGADQRAVLAVAKPADDVFSESELRRLGEVAGLIAIALEERPATKPVSKADPVPDVPAVFHHRLPAAFERLQGLPALAESRNTLLAVLGEQAPSLDAIVAAIESDVALVIALLRLANETRAAKRSTIWTVPEAVNILTPEGVEELARRITVFDFFQRVRGWTVPPEHFRLHAVMTQRAAQRLARLLDHPQADQIVVAALLHDIGKLVLMEAFPGYPAGVLSGARTPEQRLKAERRALGLDHEMAGGVLLRRWRLPDRLAEIVGRHHSGEDDPDAALIRLADALAHYAQGQPVNPRSLLDAAQQLDIGPKQLRTVMYELSQSSGSGRFRAVERSPLSSRETDILRALATGSTYKEIGLTIGLSASTVRTHLHNIYKKLQVGDRAQAVLKATERGWI